MSLSNWDKVCSEATDGHCYLLGFTKQGVYGASFPSLPPPTPSPFALETTIVRFPCHKRSKKERGWAGTAAPSSSGDQTVWDSSILPLPGRVLMWRESSLKPWASLSASRVSYAGQSPQWVAVSGSSVS